MENPSRRRMLVAGLAGTAVTALAGQRASATAPTEPPSTDTPTTETPPTSPGRPTSADVELLGLAQQLELTARDLYQLAIDEGAAGDQDVVLMTCRANHQAAADALSGMMGRDAPQTVDESLFGEWESRFTSADLQEVASAGVELENSLVATHTELIGQLEGLDGAAAIAATLLTEARAATVLADLGGQGDDLDALFDNSASALTPTEG